MNKYNIHSSIIQLNLNYCLPPIIINFIYFLKQQIGPKPSLYSYLTVKSKIV